jgi:hypothetical protein
MMENPLLSIFIEELETDTADLSQFIVEWLFTSEKSSEL